MTTMLTQSSTAGFPDRPVGGGTGLYVTIDADGNGAALAVPLDEPMMTIHQRWMFNAQALNGGRVVLMAGRDADDAEVLHVVLDAATGQIRAETPTGETVLG